MFIFLALLILGGINLLVQGESGGRSAWKMAKDQKTNHQLIATDFSEYLENQNTRIVPLNDMVGKYLTRDKKKGEELKLDDVTDLPTPNVSADSVGFIYSGPYDESIDGRLIDVGSQITICALKPPTETICMSVPLEVLAVHQKTTQVPQRWLMLKVPLDKRSELTQIIASDKQAFFFHP
jgi:hypothetical protein